MVIKGIEFSKSCSIKRKNKNLNSSLSSCKGYSFSIALSGSWRILLKEIPMEPPKQTNNK